MPQTESEEQLRHLADRLATTLEDISYAFYMLDRDWRFTYLNKQAEKLLQRDRAELLGKVIWEEFKDAVNGSFYIAYHRAIDQNTKVEVELFSSVLGLWLEVHLYPSEEGLTVYLRDINLRKREQERLRLLETCVARLNDIVIITEADSLDEPGPRIVFVNDAFERHTGYLREEVLGRSPRFLQGPQTQRGELDRIRTALMNFDPVRAELINYTKSGKPYWLELNIVPITDENGLYAHCVAVQRDITVRMKAQQQLEIHSHLLNVIGQAVIVTDVMGTVTYWNRFAETLYGWSSAEVQGRNILEVTPTDTTLQQAEEIMNILMRGESWSGEFIVQKRDGTMFPAYVTNTPVLDEAGQIIAIIGLSLDITERKQAEEALERSEWEQRELAQQLEIERSRLVAAQQVARIGSWETDLTTLEVIWSEETHRIYETDPATFHPTHPAFLTLVHPEDRAGVDAAFIRSFDQRTACEIEHRLLLTEGRIKFVEERWEIVFDDQGGEPVRAIGTCQDITERKQADEALDDLTQKTEQRERMLSAALSSMNDFAQIYDREGRLLFVNQPLLNLWGLTLEAAVGKNFFDLGYPDALAQRLQRQLLEVLATGCTILDETSYIGVDGSEGYYEYVFSPVLEFDGKVSSVVGSTRDITARKHAEQALLMAHDELEWRVAERTAALAQTNADMEVEIIERKRAESEAERANLAKSEFLSRMSHELRTPLNAILGFGQILDQQDLGPLSKESIGYILKGGRHLLGLVNEVLDIARVESGHIELSLEPIALDDIVPEACALVRPLAVNRSIRLEENIIEPGGPMELGGTYVMADRQRLKQVLINLLSNAIKYNNEGGLVEVSCSQKPDGWISLAVRDTGAGIAPQDLPKLFTPFERLSTSDTTIEGTGLGLVLSQRLMTAMGGTLRVESTLGTGTTFTLELPQVASPEEQSTNAPEARHHLGTGEEAQRTYSVLCIEDNFSNLRLMEVLFQGRPEITLLVAMQGSVGLDLARQHEPDIILLDLNLPDIHGKEILTRLQQSALTRDIPVVVISADATPGQVERLLAAGARAYLTKPLDVSQFFHTIDTLLQPSARTIPQLNNGEETL